MKRTAAAAVQRSAGKEDSAKVEQVIVFSIRWRVLPAGRPLRLHTIKFKAGDFLPQ